MQEEISIPFEEIELKESDIKVVFSQCNVAEYFFEIGMTLWDTSNQILGKYVYVEDDKGNVVDDSLVFY
ncbi:hypothetical protein [Chitinophaga rhizophila]|uniref:Uncharacterized protein n=1 Tax=Chitinophaga rhizophila TaxID=2866212 RepID=A0ABS7GHS1_9BACT|nr:hypothetical protein [Chitinophaga rhizophila]MBW8686976.1 hypothetical protein [Chitinophaga rhizophila]